MFERSFIKSNWVWTVNYKINTNVIESNFKVNLAVSVKPSAQVDTFAIRIKIQTFMDNMFMHIIFGVSIYYAFILKSMFNYYVLYTIHNRESGKYNVCKQSSPSDVYDC